MTSLSLVSLNVERQKHLDTVTRFLSERAPDVVCLQEVLESDLGTVVAAMGAKASAFEPMGTRSDEPIFGAPSTLGIAILSHFPIRNTMTDYYTGTKGILRDSVQGDVSTYNNLNRLILACDIEKNGDVFRIVTTHFTWTPDGAPSDAQRQDMKRLLGIVEHLGEHVLTGDFNAPRGGEIFAMLAARYKDNIPLSYRTSLDVNLHRSGRVRGEELADKMVDGLFTTPRYGAENVELIPGISDHCAVVANITM